LNFATDFAAPRRVCLWKVLTMIATTLETIMKYRRLAIATAGAAAGLALLALPVSAQGRHHGGASGPLSYLETFDGNADGSLQQAEVDAFRTDRLAKFDSDSDGKLTLEEYQALWLDAMRERMVDAFQRLDDDGDAVVTREEFVEPFARLVQRLDQNADGTVTQDEMRARREGFRGRHEGRRGHSGPSQSDPE
jgi:Ca2+-binding EF-hand superfamily protein